MDEPCDICGDVGIADAIATCYVCKRSRQHLYCKKVYSLDIPKFWRCEECEPSSGMCSPQSDWKGDLPKAPMENSSAIVHQNMSNSGGVNKISAISGQSRFREKWADKGKTKYIPCQEAIKLSSGSRKLESPLRNNLRSVPEASKAITARCERIFPKAPKVVSPKITSRTSFGVLGQSRPRRPDDDQINSAVQQSVAQSLTEPKENKAVRPPRKEGVHIRQPSGASKGTTEGESASTKIVMEQRKAPSISAHCPPGPLSTSGGRSVEPRSSNDDARNQRVNVSEVEKYSQGMPSRHAYWNGCFKLPDSLQHLELNDELKAHPPSKVHLKVFEVLRKLPRVLQFELIPRFKVLTDIFLNFHPDKDDIGLYFFPGNSESSEKYTSLMDFIWMEKLVMRSYVNGVELFVFSSQILHLDCQKWNGNYYLWGVFRRAKMNDDNAPLYKDKELRLVLHPSNDVDCSLREGGEMEDMDIDCLDYVAAPPLLDSKPWGDIPPGFEGTSRLWVKDSLCSSKENLPQSTQSSKSETSVGSLGCLQTLPIRSRLKLINSTIIPKNDQER